ncbi:MAG: DUF3575 domain-containing protein [Candidatus Cryptobacteroides sp.]
MMRLKTVVTWVFLLSALCLGQRACAQQFAIKVNALSWALSSPDIGAELVVGDRSSVALSVSGNYMPFGLDVRIIGVMPQYRYWLAGRPMIREYVGVSAFYSAYDLNFTKNIFKGNAVGVGLTGGYVFSLGKHWGLDLSGGLAMAMFIQKRHGKSDSYEDYYAGNIAWDNSRGLCLMPFNLGVTFIYIIK